MPSAPFPWLVLDQTALSSRYNFAQDLLVRTFRLIVWEFAYKQTESNLDKMTFLSFRI